MLLRDSRSEGDLIPTDALRSCPMILMALLGASDSRLDVRLLNESYRSGYHG
jgi:hypothetical protein